MAKSATLKELSKILGVSISTISKALNDSHEISEATKKRIQEAADLYNYQPNKIALNLKSGKTKTIGVVVPSVQNFFLAQVLLGVESVIADSTYNMIVSISNESLEKEQHCLKSLSNGLVDGFIIAVAEETQIKKDFEHFHDAMDKNKSLVMFDRVVASIDCDKVLVDDFDAVFKVVKDLLAKGKKRIVLVSTINNLSVGKQRTAGYESALDGVNTPVIIAGTEAQIEKSLHQMYDKKKFDAIVGLDQESTLAAYRVLKAHKALLTNEISIVGYTSRTIAENLTPRLSTIEQHGVEIGKIAAEKMLERLNSDESPYDATVVNTTLQQRETS